MTPDPYIGESTELLFVSLSNLQKWSNSELCPIFTKSETEGYSPSPKFVKNPFLGQIFWKMCQYSRKLQFSPVIPGQFLGNIH